MTLEEALAEIGTLKQTNQTLTQQLAAADPEGATARADLLAKQIGELTEKLNAKDGNSAKLITERDDWKAKATANLARISSLEKQIEDIGPNGVDIAQVKKDAAEAAAKETADRLHAEYKPKVDELESVKAEAQNLKGLAEKANYEDFLVSAMKELKVNPNAYNYLISRAQGVWQKDSDGKYIAKDQNGAIRTGSNGLLTAGEFFSTIVAEEPHVLLRPTGGGATGGAKQAPKNSEGSTLKPGTRRHKMWLAKANPSDHDKLYGPGGQYANL